MTAIVFVVSLLLALWHYEARGFFITGTLTIYVAAFIATLGAACVAAVISRRWRPMVAAVVLVANFAGSHYGWMSDDKILNQVVLDSATAAFFALVGRQRWELGLAIIFLLSVVSAALAQWNIIPGPNERPFTFLAWSYPDITSILGHLGSIVLGLGAGDGGVVARNFLARPTLVFALRGRSAYWLAGRAALALGFKTQG